ncbi:hypothetical protein BDV30DRAFT_235647 [Aspergillus minisclerotigenes]|uniref:Aminoglycoside phosphotransferase domain-containing protein n=1 Tax=Aspergillus minisclerotigenes TaxID=656917 RepID=A0A5N6JF58_9EURO|nr:hypothetical protein BDV30DRAFT_235647 [Aspergillus minisclerotigenes]
MLEEVQVCERLRRNPPRNIAAYHGCEVKDGSITGIYFTKYTETPMQRVNPGKLALDGRCGIADSASALTWHRHNDINPSNIMFDGNIPVIIDFDSCGQEGHSLDTVKRKYEWYDENVKEAMPSTDIGALEEMRMWLLGDTSKLKL